MIEQCFGFAKNLKHINREYRDMNIWGFDTETPNYSIKILSISNGQYTEVIDVNEKNILDKFIEYFEKYTSIKEHIVFAHNLSFDFLVLLNQDLKGTCPEFLKKECRWNYGNVRIDFFNETPYFGQITWNDRTKVVHLRDTFSFFGRVKLSKLAESLKIGHKIKIDNEDFYQRGIEKNKNFREYAAEDARLAAAIGEKIMEFHAMENVPLGVSGPQLAMNVFKKKFIPYGYNLLSPNYEQMKSFELSYHGGKNGCYRPSPIEINNVNLFDFNSAYPDAMTRIPSFMDCEYETSSSSKINGEAGIYLVDCISKCPYNSTFSHSFYPLKTLERVWITSYELENLISCNCLKKLSIFGRILVKDRSQYNPLAEYARTYYKLKSKESKESPLYLYYKVCMLNSIYGKFIERRYDEDKGYAIRGPNYNPAIASLITGYVRAKMHQLEHDTDAIHSATDAVFTKGSVKTSKELGGLSSQGNGRLCMMRTKLYLFYCGQKLEKQARHGFHGTEDQLIDMWNNHKTAYTYKKIPTAGEYLLHKKLNLKLFGMNEYKANLNIDWNMYSVV